MTFGSRLPRVQNAAGLLLLGALFVAPLAGVLVPLVVHQNDEQRFIESERAGLAYLALVDRLENRLHYERTTSLRLAEGELAARLDRGRAVNQVDAALRNLEWLDQRTPLRLGGESSTRARNLPRFVDDWRVWREQGERAQTREVWRSHEALAASLTSLRRDVCDASNLDREPHRDRDLLLVSALEKLPNFQSVLTRLEPLLADLEAGAEADVATRGQVQLRLDTLRGLVAGVAAPGQGIRAAFNYD
jgi:hypothetical protein